MLTLRTVNLNNRHAALRNFSIAAAGLSALTLAAFMPTNIHARSINIDDAEDLLEELIEMDARDIDALQADLADARIEIAEAIMEIDEAREEAATVPGGRSIARTAMRAASYAVEGATGAAFGEAWDALDDAEALLEARRAEVGAREFAETLGAIEMIREELDAIDAALDDLTEALRA